MFTAKDVVNAYEITGLQPIFGSFWNEDYTCACALSALYAAKVNPENPRQALEHLDNNKDISLSHEIAKALGFFGFESDEKAQTFVGDFWRGYDRNPNSPFEPFEDLKFGIKIRKEVEELLGRPLTRAYELGK